jgi:asparagine synthase (glutamine-hydrolysing)
MGINKQGIVFSSHYHHITSHSFFKDETINESALLNYFKYGFIQEGEGLLTNTYFVPHAHITTIPLNATEWKCEPYYQVDFTKKSSVTTKELLETYSSVVNAQLVSDVPIGCFLSGGVDSVVTVGVASQLKENITAYTIGVNDEKLDESAEAKRFANYFHVEHELQVISQNEVIQAINDYDQSMGEPLGDFSSLLMLKVCEMAKKKLTVVLSGDGGDDLFWGYKRFEEAQKYKDYFKTIYQSKSYSNYLERTSRK